MNAQIHEDPMTVEDGNQPPYGTGTSWGRRGNDVPASSPAQGSKTTSPNTPPVAEDPREEFKRSNSPDDVTYG